MAVPHIAELRISEGAFQEGRRALQIHQMCGTLMPNQDMLQRIAITALLSVEKGMMLDVLPQEDIDKLAKAKGNQ
jgi:hypothetical protein